LRYYLRLQSEGKNKGNTATTSSTGFDFMVGPIEGESRCLT
jgi:hypothetical protein